MGMVTAAGTAATITVDGIAAITAVDATGITTEIPGAKIFAKQYAKLPVIPWLQQVIPTVIAAGRAFLSRPIRY